MIGEQLGPEGGVVRSYKLLFQGQPYDPQQLSPLQVGIRRLFTVRFKFQVSLQIIGWKYVLQLKYKH